MRVPIGQKIALESYEGSWPPDDPDAGFRRLVAEYSRIDPLPTLDVLSRNKGIPVGALVRFVLARYCTSGSDALLEMGPRVVRQMDAIVREAEAVGTDESRLRPGGQGGVSCSSACRPGGHAMSDDLGCPRAGHSRARHDHRR